MVAFHRGSFLSILSGDLPTREKTASPHLDSSGVCRDRAIRADSFDEKRIVGGLRISVVHGRDCLGMFNSTASEGVACRSMAIDRAKNQRHVADHASDVGAAARCAAAFVSIWARFYGTGARHVLPDTDCSARKQSWAMANGLAAMVWQAQLRGVSDALLHHDMGNTELFGAGAFLWMGTGLVPDHVRVVRDFRLDRRELVFGADQSVVANQRKAWGQAGS